MTSISARTPNDVWAVGYAQGQDTNSQSFFDSGIAVHWNGQSWQNVCGAYCGSVVNDVDARGDGVWAVGSDGGNSSQNYFMQIQRWTGTGWARQAVQKVNVVKPPNANSWLNFLSGVSSNGGTVASVGYFVSDSTRQGFTLGVPQAATWLASRRSWTSGPTSSQDGAGGQAIAQAVVRRSVTAARVTATATQPAMTRVSRA